MCQTRLNEALERPTVPVALDGARQLTGTSAGAVAFSQTGDPDIGDFADAVVLQTFGEGPSGEDLLSGG